MCELLYLKSQLRKTVRRKPGSLGREIILVMVIPDRDYF